VKDNVCLPPIFALRRARRYLDSVSSQVTLCITGGFRDSTDIAKALALGADAVALATASLVAIGCQQYRICHTGRCPVGITTQDEALRQRFDIDQSLQRFVNFYRTTAEELANLVRINGRSDVHQLDLSDIVTISNEVSQNTDIEHV
jgi:glutamate synthase domain-containing protein 2